MVDLKDVKMVYPGSRTMVLRDIDLHIDDGEFVFLVGPSGSGKTTIIKLLTGEIQATGGSLEVNGFDLRRIKPALHGLAVHSGLVRLQQLHQTFVGQRAVDRRHAAASAGFLQQIRVKPFRHDQIGAAGGAVDMGKRLQTGHFQLLLAVMAEDFDLSDFPVGIAVFRGRRDGNGQLFGKIRGFPSRFSGCISLFF